MSGALQRSMGLLPFLCGALLACDVISGLDDFELARGGASAAGGGAMGGAGGEGAAGGGGGVVLAADCAAVHQELPTAGDGFFRIDPDGPGGDQPFDAYCDMTIEDGGWTRFHWVEEALPEDTDPLGDDLSLCSRDAAVCLGRIPAGATPTELLVKDTSQDQHAAWRFDGGIISSAVLGALRDKVPACLVDQQTPWQPYVTTSSEDYCGTGNEGGCDSFMYGEGCVGLPGWALQLDGDLFYASAAFKLGWMRTGANCGADPIWDHGYLNTQACQDEFGELYYR